MHLGYTFPLESCRGSDREVGTTLECHNRTKLELYAKLKITFVTLTLVHQVYSSNRDNTTLASSLI